MSGKARFTPEERFWPRVDKSGDAGCWLWTGGRTPAGYGAFGIGTRMVYAHRFAYEEVLGPVPDGLQLDHLCRVRHCVNPEHLEPVTRKENILRGQGIAARNARKTECASGHAFTPENTGTTARGTRFCRECSRINARIQSAKRRASA